MDDEGEKIFGQVHYIVQVGVGHFGLDHPEFGQMATGLGFLSAEGRAEAVDFSERGRSRLVIKLSGLSKIRFGIFEIIDAEQRRGSFAGGGREDRGIHKQEPMRIEIVSHGPYYFSAYGKDGMLAARAKPEMAIVHQEFNPVLFGR